MAQPRDSVLIAGKATKNIQEFCDTPSFDALQVAAFVRSPLCRCAILR